MSASPKQPPLKEEIAAMEPFTGLDLGSVFVISESNQAESACEELMRAEVVGFDTESKPTFRKGERTDGPHVLQFATVDKAFVFLTHTEDLREQVMELLISERLIKTGFDLRGDIQQISRRFGIRPASVVDLGSSFRSLGYRNTIGAVSAVAMLFNRRLHKPKAITTSNWAARELSERQLLYAANDAYAAIRVFHALRQQDVSV